MIGTPRDDATADVVAELLATDRDLTEDEQQVLARYSDGAWLDIRAQLAKRAVSTYGVADPDDFAKCVETHMKPVDRVDMMNADAYHCPQCGRLLKDRRTPVATSILVERRRLRKLYEAIDAAPEGPERDEALRRFIAALGIAKTES